MSLLPDFQKVKGVILSEDELDFHFEACPGVPDKNFSENVKPWQFVILQDGVKTDNNCNENEIT